MKKQYYNELFPVSELRCHEEINPAHLDSLYAEICKNKYFEPILVDKTTKIILDGHHRKHVAERLGIAKIPCLVVDYLSDIVKITSWRSEFKVTKEEVLRRGMSGELFPSKTSRHTIMIDYENSRISLNDLKVK